MKKVYINSIGSISAQKTFDNSEFLDEIISHNGTDVHVIAPNYKEYIPPAAARRMAKGIKMGVVASKIAMNEAGLDNVDAIITGTGLGCIVDSEKFVGAIIDNNEQYLTPTSFIQSTHNTVAGQIALGIKCKGYNFTYVHSAVSFESALLDAKLQLENDEAENILVGGVDELSDYHINIHKLIAHVKAEAVASENLLNSNTKGSVFGEGANFFVLSNEKQDTSYAQLIAVNTYNSLAKEHLESTIVNFLEENGTSIKEVDAVILGNNGDIDYDHYYNDLGKSLFKTTQQLYYKQLCGEFYTANSFALWLASKMIKTQTTPEAIKLNNIDTGQIKTVLLYNQYRAENHSLILIKKC